MNIDQRLDAIVHTANTELVAELRGALVPLFALPDMPDDDGCREDAAASRARIVRILNRLSGT